MAVTPDGKTVYVLNGDKTVTPIHTATNTVEKQIRVGPHPDLLTVVP